MRGDVIPAGGEHNYVNLIGQSRDHRKLVNSLSAVE